MSLSTLDTPVSFPEGATLLYGIGAQKAGTTWVADLLQQSPDCHFSPIKELHYFDVLYLSGTQKTQRDRVEALQKLAARVTPESGPNQQKILRRIMDVTLRLNMATDRPGTPDGYLSYLLQGYEGQKLICDITPAYSVLNTKVFRQMQKIGPAKFLFLMRDPVDRIWSQVRMAVAGPQGRKADPEAFDAACLAYLQTKHVQAGSDTVGRADYARTLTKLERAVPRKERADRILTLFYEDLFCDESVNRLCAFLGIAPIQADFGTRSNAGRAADLPAEAERMLFDLLRAQYDFAAQRYGDALPAAWADRMARMG